MMPPFSDLQLLFLNLIQTTQKNMVASNANSTPIRHSRNRTIPIRHYFTDLFLISL